VPRAVKLARARDVVNPNAPFSPPPPASYAAVPGGAGGSSGEAGTRSDEGAGTERGTGRRRGALEAGLGAAALFVAILLAARGAQPLRDWFFQFAWYPTLLLLDGGLALRTGSALLAGRPRFALSLWFWSGPTWYLFELLNLRMADWYYVFVPAALPPRWAGTFAAFATVLPAIYLAQRWMDEVGLARGWSRPRFRVRRRHYAVCLLLGAAFVLLAVRWPDAFFPLIWGASTLLLEPFNHARDPGSSLLGDLARGSWTRIVRLLAGGAGIGLLWEGYNRLAGARWIYTVPGLERLKLFEMPLPGFLGFPVFALDCFVIYHALANLGVAVPGWSAGPPDSAAAERQAAPERPATRLRLGRAPVAVVLALLFCAAVQVGLDRWTVDSSAPRLADLPGASPAEIRHLEAAGLGGARALAETDSAAVSRRAGLPPGRAGALVRAARLASLRGIGTRNAAALWRGGVRGVCALARTPQERVTALVRSEREDPRAGRPARVRVWLRAARRACGEARSPARADG